MKEIISIAGIEVSVRTCTNQDKAGNICGCTQTTLVNKQVGIVILPKCVKCGKDLYKNSYEVEMIQEAHNTRRIPNGYTGDLHHYHMRQRI